MVQVGDKFKVTKSNFFGKEATAGAIVSYVREGHRCGLGKFLTDSGVTLTFEISGDGSYPCHVEPATPSTPPVAPPTPKDPIEYLKSAHADGDMIDPATMLRECYGITKTERVVVEWSDATKREIKVGDKVRIVGNKWSDIGFAHRFEMGEIVEITEIDPFDKKQPYRAGAVRSWLAADDVELI